MGPVFDPPPGGNARSALRPRTRAGANYLMKRGAFSSADTVAITRHALHSHTFCKCLSGCSTVRARRIAVAQFGQVGCADPTIRNGIKGVGCHFVDLYHRPGPSALVAKLA